MASDSDIAAAGIKAAKEAIKMAWEPVRRELARRGAENASTVSVGSNDPQLDEALDLLAAHSSLATAPLLGVKSWLSAPPEIFNIIAVREWVADPAVRDAAKRMARAYIAGVDPNPSDEQALVDKYAEHTLDHPRMAPAVITQLLNFLALSINRWLSPADATILTQGRDQTQAIRTDIADLVSGVGVLHGKIDALQALQSDVPRLPHDYADRELTTELNQVLRRRHFFGNSFSEEIAALVDRVTTGDLQLASALLRSDPIRRAARLAASTGNSSKAEAFLVLAKRIDPATSMAIEEAWLAAAKGNVSAAVTSLWKLTDAEHRSALLGIIKHYQGSTAAVAWLADARLTSADLTGAGAALAINLHLEASHWEDAARYAEDTSDGQRHDAPNLEALVGLTAILLVVPTELRGILLDQDLLPFFDLRSVSFRDDAASRAKLVDAARHFQKAAADARALGLLQAAALYEDIALWLAFQDPATRPDAEKIIAKSMQDDALVFRRLRFALSYNVSFNRRALEAEIERREKVDATTAETIAADLILAVHTFKSAPADLAAFIARKRNLLLRHLNKKSLAGIEIEALANGGQVGSARSLLAESRELFSDPLAIQRLEAVVAEAGGADVVATRKATYESSGKALPDLYALVDALRQRKDWTELRPFARELFNREGTVDAALLVYHCCRETKDEDALSEFLAGIGSLAGQCEHLNAALAWDHYRHGRLKDAKRIIDQLRKTRAHSDDRNLAINIAVESGDWNSLHVIVEDAWVVRNDLPADDLISLARLAFEIGNSRMLPLAELAVSKAPADPAIHINGWLLANEAGALADHPNAASWFEVAAKHSGKDGPLHAVSMREFAADQPRRQERNQRVAQGIYDASIPLFLAAENLGVPLSQFIGGAAIENAQEQDGRRVVPIHAFHGGRARVTLASVKTLGLDLTALIVLAHLGFLQKVIDSFERIVVPAGTLAHLFADRQRIRFHQPALVAEAERLQSLLGNRTIARMENPAQPNVELANDVGLELAELIATAERDGGIVIAPAPIHKVASFMEVEADTSTYASLLSDTRTILHAPALAGFLDAVAKERATTYLTRQDRGWPTAAAIAPDRPIYLTSLAISYLSTAGLLPHLSRLGAPVFVSR